MPSHIPESRLGRALKAGIPVALILIGAELLDGSVRIAPRDAGYVIAWSSDPLPRNDLTVRIVGRLGCDAGWTMRVEAPLPGWSSGALRIGAAIGRIVAQGASAPSRAEGRPGRL